MRRLHADLLLLACAVIWGAAFYYQKSAMAHVGPLLFLAARAAVAALALVPFAIREARMAGAPLGEPKGFLRVVLAGGVLFFAGGILQQAGIVTATVTNAGFLTGLYVVVTPLIAWAFTGRPPGRIVWGAVALAFLGAWALGGGTIGGMTVGDGLVALSALFWAAHLVVTGSQSRHGRPALFTCLQFIVVFLLAAAGALMLEPISLDGLASAWVAIAFVGLFSSALTFTLLAIAMRHTPPAETAILVSMETVFATLAGMLLLGERLAPIGWAGAVLMFIASTLVPLAPWIERRLTRNAGREDQPTPR